MKYLLLIIVLASGCNNSPENTQGVYTVQLGSVQNTVGLAGRAETAEQLNIVTPDELSVTKLMVTAGQKVKKGDTLCTLDTHKIQELIKNDELKLQQLELQHKTLQIRFEGQKNEVLKFDRLYASGAVSLDEKQKELQELRIQETQLSSIEKEITFAQENLAKRKNDAELLEIKSPYDAVISYMWTNKDTFVEGSSVKKGDILFKLSVEGKMIVRASLREQDVTHFTIGQKLNLTFPNYPGLEMVGKVQHVDSSASIDKESGIASYRINIEFTPTPEVRPGMEVSIEHLINKKENVTIIPKTALNPVNLSTGQVMYVQGSNKVKKDVKLGLIGDAFIEVTGGLKVGDTIKANYEE